MVNHYKTTNFSLYPQVGKFMINDLSLELIKNREIKAGTF